MQQNLGHTTLEMVRRYVHLASRMAAIRSQSFSPLDRLNIKEGRRFKHSFNQESADGRIYPNVGAGTRSRKKASASGPGGGSRARGAGVR